MPVISVEHIALRENGAPYIAGKGVKVANIATLAIMHGWSIEKIADEFDLTPAQIHAALAYYYDHQDEIDSAVRAGDELAKQTGISIDDLRRHVGDKIPSKDE